jgi:hypothetical protein
VNRTPPAPIVLLAAFAALACGIAAAVVAIDVLRTVLGGG